jgi:hypothetical protein
MTERTYFSQNNTRTFLDGFGTRYSNSHCRSMQLWGQHNGPFPRTVQKVQESWIPSHTGIDDERVVIKTQTHGNNTLFCETCHQLQRICLDRIESHENHEIFPETCVCESWWSSVALCSCRKTAWDWCRDCHRQTEVRDEHLRLCIGLSDENCKENHEREGQSKNRDCAPNPTKPNCALQIEERSHECLIHVSEDVRDQIQWEPKMCLFVGFVQTSSIFLCSSLKCSSDTRNDRVWISLKGLFIQWSLSWKLAVYITFDHTTNDFSFIAQLSKKFFIQLRRG